MSELEQKLLAFWTQSAREWRRRSHLAEQAKGDEAEKRGYVVKLAPRPVPRKVKGTMRLIESADMLTSPTAICVQCGIPFSPYDVPTLYCSTRCKARARYQRTKARA
jgi:hypothetical protein